VSKLPVPTAKEINDAHAYAKECAETAVEHAIKCGKLLARKKEQLGRGDFDEWVKTYCDFGRSSAYAYLKVAARSPAELGDFRSIQHALGYEKPKEISRTSSRPLDDSAASNSPKGAVPVVKAPADRPEATGETGTDRPAAPISPPAPPVESPPPAEGEWTPADEAAANAEAEADERERIAVAMTSDDKLAAAFEQIKQQAALLSVANAARNRAMNQAAEAVRLLKAEQRKVSRLERELEKLRGKKAA
jgi:hypothetical protein